MEYDCSLNFDPWAAAWALMLSEIRRTHGEFLTKLCEVRGYDPLPIIMRAVNGLRLRWQSRAAPRWRRGRWKAKA
jgi:hypothetical protein